MFFVALLIGCIGCWLVICTIDYLFKDEIQWYDNLKFAAKATIIINLVVEIVKWLNS